VEGRKWNGYVEKEKKKMMKKKKKDMDHSRSEVVCTKRYLKGKDTHVGRDCRIWRIRLFL